MSDEETTLLLARRGFSPEDREEMAREFGLGSVSLTAEQWDWTPGELLVPPPRRLFGFHKTNRHQLS